MPGRIGLAKGHARNREGTSDKATNNEPGDTLAPLTHQVTPGIGGQRAPAVVVQS